MNGSQPSRHEGLAMDVLDQAKNRNELTGLLCDQLQEHFQAERVALLEWSHGAPFVLMGKGLSWRLQDPEFEGCGPAAEEGWLASGGSLGNNLRSSTAPLRFPGRFILTCPVQLPEGRRFLLYVDRRITQGQFESAQAQQLEQRAQGFLNAWAQKPGYSPLQPRVFWGVQRYFDSVASRQQLAQRLLAKVKELFEPERAALVCRGASGFALHEGLGFTQELLDDESFASSRRLLEQTIDVGRGPMLVAPVSNTFTPQRGPWLSGIRTVLSIRLKDQQGQLGVLYLDRHIRQGMYDLFSFADLEKIADLALACGLSLAPPLEQHDGGADAGVE